MIYSNLLKKHYSDWPSLEKAIEALPTAKARGNVFEEFTFAYFTIKKQMYQIAEIYRKRLSKYIFYSSFSLLTFATKK